MARISFALIFSLFFATSYAFMKSGPVRSMVRANAVSMKMDLSKTVVAIAPALLSAPAFASELITSTMSTANEVTGPAYLAVLLGTFVPVTFLIVLYAQSEARKAGARGE